MKPSTWKKVLENEHTLPYGAYSYSNVEVHFVPRSIHEGIACDESIATGFQIVQRIAECRQQAKAFDLYADHLVQILSDLALFLDAQEDTEKLESKFYPNGIYKDHGNI